MLFLSFLDEIQKMGNNLIIVTNEEEIAKHAKRIIRLKDGIIEEDSMNYLKQT